VAKKEIVRLMIVRFTLLGHIESPLEVALTIIPGKFEYKYYENEYKE